MFDTVLTVGTNRTFPGLKSRVNPLITALNHSLVTYNVHHVASAASGTNQATPAKFLSSKSLANRQAMALKLHFPLCPLPRGADRGTKLISWTQDAVVAVPQTSPETKSKSKHSLLPVLIVLFLVSYGLMSLLAVEQDRTIASQRSLITSLLNDSSELSSLKGKIIQKQYAQSQAQAEADNASQGQTPSTQVPRTQDPPGSNVQRNRNAGKMRKGIPPKPPLGVADIVDGRRIVKAI